MPTTRKPIPTQATLLSLSEDALRRALAHVPLNHHGALAQTCKRLRAVKQATRFRRERANSGCEESVLIVTGGSDARDDTWNEHTFVLQADGTWRARRGRSGRWTSCLATAAPTRSRTASSSSWA